eukprot:scaffold23_cov113-Isochrysis_galbana.AAC.11
MTAARWTIGTVAAAGGGALPGGAELVERVQHCGQRLLPSCRRPFSQPCGDQVCCALLEYRRMSHAKRHEPNLLLFRPGRRVLLGLGEEFAIGRLEPDRGKPI